jgi:hypothetical protein
MFTDYLGIDTNLHALLWVYDEYMKFRYVGLSIGIFLAIVYSIRTPVKAINKTPTTVCYITSKIQTIEDWFFHRDITIEIHAISNDETSQEGLFDVSCDNQFARSLEIKKLQYSRQAYKKAQISVGDLITGLVTTDGIGSVVKLYDVHIIEPIPKDQKPKEGIIASFLSQIELLF